MIGQRQQGLAVTGAKRFHDQQVASERRVVAELRGLRHAPGLVELVVAGTQLSTLEQHQSLRQAQASGGFDFGRGQKRKEGAGAREALLKAHANAAGVFDQGDHPRPVLRRTGMADGFQRGAFGFEPRRGVLVHPHKSRRPQLAAPRREEVGHKMMVPPPGARPIQRNEDDVEAPQLLHHQR